jgi:hypothetical protein
MKTRPLILVLLIAVLLALAVPGSAQSAELLAYTNSGGQLVITRPGTDFRWIVTNPGESLLPNVNLAWSDDGKLLFGVGAGGGYSLRVADTVAETVGELIAGSGALAGGAWTNTGDVLVGTGQGVVQLTPGADAVLRVPGGAVVDGASVSPDGGFVMLADANGSYLIGPAAAGASLAALPGQNRTPYPAGIGVWSTDAPLVAYWTAGSSGTTVLGIANAASGAVLEVDSGSSVPVTPLTWIPGTGTLIYLSATGVSAVDASCLASGGCSGTPASTTLLPVNAQDVAASANGSIVFTLDGVRYAAPANCVAAGNCTNAALAVGQVAARTPAYTAGNVTAFTGAADGTAQLVDIICAFEGAGGQCPPVPAVTGQVVGASPDGTPVLVVAGNNLVALSDTTVQLGSATPNTRLSWSR